MSTLLLKPGETASSTRTFRLLVTGGGTGGHTTPAAAAIQAVREIAEADGFRLKMMYLGSLHGMEKKVAQDLGVPFAGIETGKLRRSRNPLGLFSAANIRDALRVPVGYAQAVGAVRRFRPDVALSTGGYVSVPGVLAAAAMRIPVVAHEQTVQVGLANRINFRVACVIALSVDETLSVLPPGQRSRALVTGNPVRSMIFGGNPAEAVRRFELNPGESDLPGVYITGGAQGSRLINRAVEEALPELPVFCRIIHQCGVQPAGREQDFDRLTAAKARLPESLRGRYAVTQFVGSEIGDVYALADIIVGRSGAGTVTEVCALGKPALFIPLVPTGGDEQTRNAMRLVNAGAGSVVKQDELDGTRLAEALRDLASDRRRLVAMGENARKLSSPDAAVKLARAVVGAVPPSR